MKEEESAIEVKEEEISLQDEVEAVEEEDERKEKGKEKLIEDSPEISEVIPKPTLLGKVLAELFRRWFLIAIGCTVLLALAFSNLGKRGGTFRAEITSQVAIGCIFFLSGFVMRPSVMLKALKQWKLHLFIQVFSFVIFPLCAFALVKLLELAKFNRVMLDGILFLSCIPTTISSNVVITKQAQGNDSAALFNSALGNSLGVVVSPAVLFVLYSGSDVFSKVPIAATFLNLFETVIIPLLLGQAFRVAYVKVFKKENQLFARYGNILNAILLLYVLFCSFSQAFQSQVRVSTLTLLGTLGLVVFIQFSMISLVFVLTMPNFWHFSRADRIAAMFCGPQKTLSIGLVLIDSMFGNDPSMALVSVPLVMYNPVQILWSGMLAPKMKEWGKNDPKDYGPIPLEPM